MSYSRRRAEGGRIWWEMEERSLEDALTRVQEAIKELELAKEDIRNKRTAYAASKLRDARSLISGALTYLWW